MTVRTLFNAEMAVDGLRRCHDCIIITANSNRRCIYMH